MIKHERDDFMSTREMAYNIIDSLDEEQLKKFIDFFYAMFYEIPNDETMEAIMESEKMLNDENTRRFHSVDELFEELDS